MSAPSVSSGTNTAYRRRANQLRIRVARLRQLHPDDVLPIHIVEHVLSRAAQPDLLFENPKPRIGAGVSGAESAANHNGNPKRGKDQSATQSGDGRSEEHTSELQSLMRISYAVFRLQKKTAKASH